MRNVPSLVYISDKKHVIFFDMFKIQIVMLMAKFESSIMVIRRKLRRKEAAEVSECHTITSSYQKFLETGSVEDTASVPEDHQQLPMT